MNILLVAKLSDNSLNCILEPLLKLQNVTHIYVLRDTVGNITSEKITYVIDKSLNSKNKFRHLTKIKKGLSICKNQKIDFIIGILLYPHGYIGRLISFITGLPYIHVTIAGHREFWVMGKLIEKINLFVFRKSYMITVTGQNTSEYLSMNGFDSNRISILPNVINMQDFIDLGEKRDYDIISMSRIDKNKNISMLLRALSKTKKKLKLRALIAGDGSEYNNLLKEAKDLGIEDNVDFIGWVDKSRKNEIYNRAKIFVLCSKGEGFPLSLLEAMACGCVPVVTDVGDISDAIKDNVNGFLIRDHKNENELVTIFEKLFENPEKIKKISTNAKDIKSKLSFENVQERWNKILKVNKSN